MAEAEIEHDLAQLREHRADRVLQRGQILRQDQGEQGADVGLGGELLDADQAADAVADVEHLHAAAGNQAQARDGAREMIGDLAQHAILRRTQLRRPRAVAHGVTCLPAASVAPYNLRPLASITDGAHFPCRIASSPKPLSRLATRPTATTTSRRSSPSSSWRDCPTPTRSSWRTCCATRTARTPPRPTSRRW